MIGIKVLNLNQTIFQMVQTHPALLNQLAELGFSEIAKPGMIQTVGRFMKLEQGCRLRKIDFALVKEKLMALGYEIKEEINE